MKIEFIDLKKQYRLLKNEINPAMQKVFDSGEFVLGGEVGVFERRLAEFCGTKYAVGLNSGTDALFLALRVLPVKKGDEVITTPFSMIAAVEAIVANGARPVFVDIDPTTFNIDPLKIGAKITRRTKAIVPVHLFGQPARMELILKIAKRYNLCVVEDAAQAIGARIGRKKAGSFGNIGCFSFFPTKNLGAYGDAGAIVTNDEELAVSVKKLRAHGATKKYYHDLLGVNSRLDNLQAAILNVKFGYLDKWISERRKRAHFYDLSFRGTPQISQPAVFKGACHVYHQYTVLAEERDSLREFLAGNGIATMIYYPLPLHLQPVLGCFGYKNGDLPIAETIVKSVLSLPIYPELSLSDQKFVIRKIKEFYDHNHVKR